MIFWFCAFVTVIWLGLAFFWHGFWRVDQRLPLAPEPLASYPSVTAIIPARNEQETIATSVGQLHGQEYNGDFSIIVANDSSTDKTREVLLGLQSETANLAIVDTEPLPSGWVGKMWALHSGIKQAETAKPDYYWLSDADIAHQPGVLNSLVAHAEMGNLALVSQMVALRCTTFWEKLLVPAFIFYFTLIYPFRAINNPDSAIAGAAGGSILIRRDALERIGGIETLKGAIIDDCTLAKLIKQSGGKIWLGFGERSRSLRGYDQLSDFWQMVQRSAYTQLKFSPILLFIAVAGIAVSHVLPVTILCLPALIVMAAIYWPTVRFYGLSPLWVLTLPIAAVLFGAMTISSALAYHLGWSNQWRNREIGGS
ncbi:hypothetical protein MNBD_ALPHA08-1191 [hydrothermal vent metagenome]|uniref:Glycosyltransferase 2-like domain-containing protein n=1 Tax=hydrothermal vent metagenome TaxID=652676 RepID=A0A3B0RT19_9ZZZZ